VATFTDDFTRGDSDALGNGWDDDYLLDPSYAHPDYFSILGGKARATGNGGDSGGAKAPTDANADWDVTVYVTRKEGDPAAGIFARATSDEVYYFFYVDPWGWSFYKAINGPWTQLDYGELTWDDEETKKLRFTVIGNVLTGYVNDVQVGQVENSDITSAGFCGMFFMGSSSEEAWFDDFSATAAEAPIPIEIAVSYQMPVESAGLTMSIFHRRTVTVKLSEKFPHTRIVVPRTVYSIQHSRTVRTLLAGKVTHSRRIFHGKLFDLYAEPIHWPVVKVEK